MVKSIIACVVPNKTTRGRLEQATADNTQYPTRDTNGLVAPSLWYTQDRCILYLECRPKLKLPWRTCFSSYLGHEWLCTQALVK